MLLVLYYISTVLNEAKALIKHIKVIVKSNSIVHHVIQIKNGTMVNVNVGLKSIARAKTVIFGILAHLLVRIANI